MDLDFNSPLVVALMFTGGVAVVTSIQTFLRYPWLNIPAGLMALLVTVMGVDPAKAGGYGIPAYALGIGFAALAFWRSRRIILRRRSSGPPPIVPGG